MDIEYHADDYGLFLTQSQEILDCYQNGCLNAISIMTNSSHLTECMDIFQPYKDGIKVAIHLNFMEGHSLCPVEDVSRLTDLQGIFNIPFGKLLLADLLPGRQEYRMQLRREIRAQLHAGLHYLGHRTPLRIDGHAHWHMLPAVFDGLIQVLQEENMEAEYIRIPQERLSVYLRNWSSLEGIKPINIVKVMVLNILAVRNRWKHKEYLSHLENRVFFGVGLSGNMTAKNVAALLPDVVKDAERKGWGIELLAHPGGVYDPSDVLQLTSSDDVKFLTSDSRKREKEMFCIKEDT